MDGDDSYEEDNPANLSALTNETEVQTYCNPKNTQRLISTPSTATGWTAFEPECVLRESASTASTLHRSTTTSNESSAQDDVILSVFWKKGKLGAAIYTVETSTIHVLNDTAEIGPDYKILQVLFRQLCPTHIVTTGSQPQDFMSAIKELANTGNDQTLSPTSLPVPNKLHFLPSQEFKYEVCKHRIALMKVSSFPPNASDAEKLIYLQSIVDLSSEALVSALGALLSFLDKSMTRLTLQRQQTYVLAIYNLNLNNYVSISAGTYKALQIFPVPYKVKTSCGVREEMNLLKLYDRCQTRMGSKRLRHFLSLPTTNRQELEKRHQVIRFLLILDNSPLVSSIISCLKGISNIATIITRMKMVRASVAQWKSLYKTMYNAVQIGEMCAAETADLELFQKITSCLNEDLYFVVECIPKIMDFRESENQEKFVVNADICPELDELKEHHRKIPIVMTEVAKQELNDLPEYIRTCSIIYIPEIGYLLTTPFWKETMDEDDFLVPGLEHKFNSHSTAHFKSARCKELDEVLGDSQLAIVEKEAQIMLQLIQFIEVQLPCLQKLLDCIVELDCLLSLSIVANEFKLVEPVLVEEKVIEIKKGQHPFLEHCSNISMANDYVSSVENGTVKIITGPSATGKSIYCKQNLLIIYLAHTGCFVPAESAKIGIIDAIHLVIPSFETASLNLSCFMLDLQQLSSITLSTASRSIIVLDDFGKGTTDTDGVAILGAFIISCINKDADCPHLIVTTHLHELFSVLPPSTLVKFQTMAYLMEEERVVPLFKLKDGSTKTSFAIQTMKACQFPEPIIVRSSQVLEAIRNQKPIPPNEEFSAGRKKRVQVMKRILSMRRETEDDLQEIIRLLKSCPRD